MTKDDLKTLLRTYMYDEDVTIVMSAVEAYSSALIAAKPVVSGSGNVCPKCGDMGIIEDKHGIQSTCPCHLR